MPFKVRGAFCPACGSESLVYDESLTHELSCTDFGCPRMMAAQEILADPQRTDHLVVLHATGYSIRHPLIERLDDGLLHCSLASWVAEFGHDYVDSGGAGSLTLDVVYRMWGGGVGEGHIVMWPVVKGRAIPYAEDGL